MKKYDWNQLKGDMLFAWQQCIDEGLAVEEFKNECKLCDESEKYSEQDAENLYEKMKLKLCKNLARWMEYLKEKI